MAVSWWTAAAADVAVRSLEVGDGLAVSSENAEIHWIHPNFFVVAGSSFPSAAADAAPGLIGTAAAVVVAAGAAIVVPYSDAESPGSLRSKPPQMQRRRRRQQQQLQLP